MSIWESKEVVVSIGNTQITGKDAICKEMNVNQPSNVDDVLTRSGERLLFHKAPLPVEITMTFLVPADKFVMENFTEDYKPQIRNKKVDDCTVKELLYSIRMKVADNKQ